MKSQYRDILFVYDSDDILYLLGVYFGDGSIRHRDNNYEFSLGTIDYEMAEKIANIVEDIRGIRPNITGKVEVKKMFYRLSFGYENLLKWIYEETNNKQKIPEFLFSLPDKKLKYFLAGYMDTDGFVCERKNKLAKSDRNMGWSAGWNTVSLWADDMRRLFNKVGILSGSFRKRRPDDNPKHKDRYDCNLLIESFAKSGLPLVVKRKQQRVENYLNYKNPQRLHVLPLNKGEDIVRTL